MFPRTLRWLFPSFVAAVLISPNLSAQERPAAIGSIEANGQISVNGSAIQSGTSLFAGDTVRTGIKSAAGIAAPLRGMLVLSEQTEVGFPSIPRYFASVKIGSVGFSALAGIRNFQIEVSQYVVVPSLEVESGGEIHRAADGSAQVSCARGSIGVIAMEGDQSLFLQPGQVALILPDGSLRRGAPTPPGPGPGQQPPSKPPVAKSGGGRRVALIVLAAGVGGAAAALAGRGGGATPVSPSRP